MIKKDYCNDGAWAEFVASIIMLVIVIFIVCSFVIALFAMRNEKIAHSNKYKQILEIAVEDCDSSIVRLLVKLAVDIHDTRGLGVELLHSAAKVGCLEIVQFLAKEKVDISATRDESKRTALHYAAEQGNLEIVKFLLRKGANPNVKEFEEKTPGDLASIMLWNNKNSNKPYRETTDLLYKAEKRYNLWK
ncbi:ankyrin repeat domain-containing protein [Wolbachia endosymbiont of Folsomia candida]|uniref:ankyrin repeat domain-containing protein n=1 Tax=Wolbachia endosymbiont of Folsomia candida TaxID=169402 RepID=UPI000A7B2FAA|nr:ankyrin repeat domain-containing protein [Wolbachia endosymbiont of Folsomia candida]APR98625.1 ankyrin repeat domain-containing protein [Wolbachia endosymbiont of Folsomia candida]